MTDATLLNGIGLALPPEILDRLADALAERTGVTPSPWMSADRAAEYLDVPKKRIQNLTSAGRIPHHKEGGRVLYRRDELDAWLAEHYEGPRHLARA